MQKIDFNVSKEKLKYELLHSSDGLDRNSNVSLFEYFEDITKYRHNVLHFCVLNSLGKEWSEEKTIAEHFGVPIDDGKNFLKTPDIIFKYKDISYIIDVSISIDIHKTEYDKYNKYKQFEIMLKKYEYSVIYLHVNIHSSFYNLEKELNKISFMFVNDFDFLFFNECTEILENKKELISSYIDKEYFENKKLEKYSNKVEIQLENLGSYSDLNINKEAFDSYNKNYKHEEKLKNKIKEFKEDDLISYLTTILTKKNEVYQKYSDDECNTKQFDDAYKNIVDDNKKRRHKIPKPTHHIIIPFEEEINGLKYEKGKNSEQKMILNFFLII